MKRVLLALFVLVLIAGAAAAAWLYVSIGRPYRGYTAPEIFVDIPTGSSSRAMAAQLADARVVSNPLAFRIAVWWRGAGRRLQAGEYRFDRPTTAIEVVDRIARGEVYLVPVTFREGLTIRQQAQIFEERGFGSAADFIKAASNPSGIRALDPAASDLEGYLFPDTYTLPRRANAEQLVARMVGRFEQALTPEIRESARARGLSTRELVTLASLVEKEAARPDEREIISAVYWNRLRIGMGLQCDPTVIYALERAGLYKGNLTRENLRFDSPYNTYRYAGLPPGPIAAPGQASLAAAAQPADVPYLYFVSRNDGSHVFATTLEEHNRNVQEWQVRYFRERRLRGAGNK